MGRSASHRQSQAAFEGKARRSGECKTGKSRVAATNCRFSAQRSGPDMNCRLIVLPNSDNSTVAQRSEEHTSELQSRLHLVCRLLLEKKNSQTNIQIQGRHDISVSPF